MTKDAKGDGSERPVVVLAASALRSAPLEAVAADLRARGAQVEVVAGVDRRRVDLLKLSFRHRGQAAYLLLGGPALRDEALRSIAVELEANGVPNEKIWSGAVPWDDDQRLQQSVGDPLRSMKALPGRPPLLSANVPTLSAEDIEDIEDIEPPPRVPRAAWAVAAAALVGIATIGAFSMGEGDAAAREAETALASVAAPENVAFPDPAEPADEAPTAEPMRAADPLDARDPSPEVLDAPEGADADLEVAPEPEPVDLPADDGALVYAALRSQAIRAIDILLVSPVATKKRGRRTYVAKVNYETAREYCENLNVDGVVGWRLPAVGEAKWLSASNLIRNGIYWTATKADAFGDERIIWNPRANKMRASGQRWRGGRAVCVRFSNPEDPGPG